MIGPSTGPVLDVGRQEIVDFQVYSIWGSQFRVILVNVFQPVLFQPAISFKILLLILLFVATKMSSSPPAMHIGDFS
jgi:hypothetical protein